MKTLSYILRSVAHQMLTGGYEKEVQHITADSRKAHRGSIFVALCGTQVDGHNYIDRAIEAGCDMIVLEKEPSHLQEGVSYVKVPDTALALGLIAAEFYEHPSEKLHLVGVTGTNGKTTTATLLYEVFTRMGHKCGLFSTVKNIVAEREIPARQTTPDIITLNSLMSEMVKEGCTHCFMEVSSHALHQKRVAGVTFAGAIFSNLTHDHLDYHHTFAAYRDAKKLLFDTLHRDAFALVNVDDRNGAFMLQNTHAHKRTYSLTRIADFKCKILEESFQGMWLTIDGRDIHLPLTGRFNAYNALAVYATAVMMGEEPVKVLEALSMQNGVSGRFETWTSGSGVICIVDYAHTPDALENVIKTINELRTQNETFCIVVGCGGDRDKEKRPVMARIAASGADRTILTADNPRSEDPLLILQEMNAGIPASRAARVVTIPDRAQAIRTACMTSRRGDIILVAGKGHETYQEINGVRLHFDDMEELKNYYKNIIE